MDDATQKGDVAAGTDWRIEIGNRCGAGETRVYHHQPGLAVGFGFHHPLETAGMSLGGIATHDQN